MNTLVLDVRELDNDEIDHVSGGAFWLPAISLAARCAASSACRNGVKAGAVGLAGGAAALFGYNNNRVR